MTKERAVRVACKASLDGHVRFVVVRHTTDVLEFYDLAHHDGKIIRVFLQGVDYERI